MFTYCIEDNILFSGDFLGCHFCMEKGLILNTDASDFLSAFKYYFEVIMGPFKEHVLKALDKIKDLDIKMVCTSHGPVLVEDIDKYMELYRQWSQPYIRKSDRKYVLIGYVSAYGYTQTIAEALYKRLSQNQSLDVDLIDLSEYELDALKDRIENADGILIGSPTFNQDALKPVWDALSVVCPINVRGRLAAAFGSFGWSGEAVKLIEDRMKGLKFKVVESGLRFNFTPSDMDLQVTEEFADKFAELLTT
jgi:NADH oxidase (H2O-forming)